MDDADDERLGDGCIGHDWRVTCLTLAGDGAYLETVCCLCGAVTIVGPDELTGRVG